LMMDNELYSLIEKSEPNLRIAGLENRGSRKILHAPGKVRAAG
jgi:hypothetical protein